MKMYKILYFSNKPFKNIKVRDRDNYTKMYFVRKYQLPPDVHPQDVTSSIDSAVNTIIFFKKIQFKILGTFDC